jgi:hypothetical protein
MSGDSVLGLGKMLHGLFHFWDEHISKDGAWWILALDSMLLIPLIFAVFFYPTAVLAIVAGAAALTVGFMTLRRLVHVRNRHPHA